MKVIIAGGRDYQFTDADKRWLTEKHGRCGFTEVVSGGAEGADSEGERWAVAQGILVKRFPAQWRIHGKSAGPIRNKAMADYLVESGDGMVILFPGGAGTADMKATALKAGLRVVERKV